MSTVAKMLKLMIMTQFTNRPITIVTNGQKHFGESKSAVRLALALLKAKLWAFKVSPLVVCLVAATFLHNWKVWIML
jgi:hypothetical protein